MKTVAHNLSLLCFVSLPLLLPTNLSQATEPAASNTAATSLSSEASAQHTLTEESATTAASNVLNSKFASKTERALALGAINSLYPNASGTDYILAAAKRLEVTATTDQNISLKQWDHWLAAVGTLYDPASSTYQRASAAYGFLKQFPTGPLADSMFDAVTRLVIYPPEHKDAQKGDPSAPGLDLPSLSTQLSENEKAEGAANRKEPREDSAWLSLSFHADFSDTAYTPYEGVLLDPPPESYSQEVGSTTFGAFKIPSDHRGLIITWAQRFTANTEAGWRAGLVAARGADHHGRSGWLGTSGDIFLDVTPTLRFAVGAEAGGHKVEFTIPDIDGEYSSGGSYCILSMFGTCMWYGLNSEIKTNGQSVEGGSPAGWMPFLGLNTSIEIHPGPQQRLYVLGSTGIRADLTRPTYTVIVETCDFQFDTCWGDNRTYTLGSNYLYLRIGIGMEI